MVAQALALDGSASGLDLCAPGAILSVHQGLRADVVRGPRVGIEYASPADQSALRRYALKGSRAAPFIMRIGQKFPLLGHFGASDLPKK